MKMDVFNIILLSTLAGLGTGIGGLLAIMKRPKQRLFGLLMGFACGIMFSISFLELLGRTWEGTGYLITTFAFGLGAIVIFALDILLPHLTFSIEDKGKLDHRLYKTGILTMIGITLHNFPEGLVVAASYFYSPSFGILMTILIALHNIPEGIATAAPLYSAGLSKMKSFRTSLLSGLSEPVGAILTVIFLRIFRGLTLVSLAFAAGVMVFLTIDELLPVTRKYGEEHFVSFGLISGLVTSLILSGFMG